LDEVREADKANETAAADEPVVDETIAIEPRTEDRLDESTEEESSSSFMPIAIIIALVVAGGAYFLLKSDPGEKSKVTTSNTSHEGSTADKAETQKTASMPAIKEMAPKRVEKAADKAASESKPVAMKPLLGDSSDKRVPDGSSASAIKTADTMAPSSTVTVHLEVDPVTRKVISPRDGKTTFAWAINLISLSTHAAADRIITELNADGVETELVQVNIADKSYFRIRVPNFTSVEEADKAHVSFKENPAYKNSWVSRYRK